jgi:hypothetical protein
MKSWQAPLKNKEDFIKPLIGVITSEQDFATVRLAAEAMLMFGYSQVQLELEKAVGDASLPVAARINVIYAIKRHPDKQAVVRLVSLMDSPDAQIVEAARSGLADVGIVASPDPAVRRQTLIELQQRGAEAFLRERLIRQETRMRELQTDREGWQKKYLTALGALYDVQGDEAAKVEFLDLHLGAQEVRVKVWALERLEELRLGTGTSKAKFSKLETRLISLISDPSREVRLNTARRLAALWELNVAKPLLDQLNIEQDEQVRREILVALREACYYAASDANTGPKIPEEIRTGTLEWAVRFLKDADAEKARRGAQVIGRLLEQNGLKPEERDGYLKALADRYTQIDPANDAGLRGYLLSAMAGLCSSRSACRDPAAKQFVGLFEQALTDQAETVRLAAADGLVNIDKTSALKKLRKDLAGDPIAAIRVKVIDLAGEAGGPAELDWLAEKLGVVDESESAWQAMLKIFGRSDVAVVTAWATRIKSPALTGKLTIEQRISFFVLAEQKARRENKADLLKDAQTNLADLYVAANKLKQASEQLEILVAGAAAGPEKLRLQGRLVRVYLGLASMEQVCSVLSNYLDTKGLELGPDSDAIKCIDEYLGSPTAVNPAGLLEGLQKVKASDSQTEQVWRILLTGWTERYAKARKPDEGDRADN